MAVGITQASEAHQMSIARRQMTTLDKSLDQLAERIEQVTERNKLQRALLDRLLTCVPGPDSKGYKLAEIMKIAEEWQNIR
jgi:hypothetical protein